MQVAYIRTQNGLVIFQKILLTTTYCNYFKQAQPFEAAQKWKQHPGDPVPTEYCLSRWWTRQILSIWDQLWNNRWLGVVSNEAKQVPQVCDTLSAPLRTPGMHLRFLAISGSPEFLGNLFIKQILRDTIKMHEPECRGMMFSVFIFSR